MNTRSAEDVLWASLHDLFEEDDGSLPEVRLVGWKPGGSQLIFDALLARSGRVRGHFWDPRKGVDVDVADDMSAPSLVERSVVNPFHVVFDQIECDGVAIPSLGAFFFQEEIALDYRMGGAWNAEVLGAFVRLLGLLVAVAEGGTVDLEEYAIDEVRARFRASVAQYLAQSTGTR